MGQFDYHYQDGFGADERGSFDTENGDERAYFGPIGRSAINAGQEANIPAFKLTRYFNEVADFNRFKAEFGDNASIEDLDEWFGKPDPWWDGLQGGDRELLIHQAASRREQNWGVYGDSLRFPSTGARERWEMEKRNGVAHGSMY